MIKLRLPDSAVAPSIARVAIRDALKGHPAQVREVAVLLADELVTNALVHAGGEIELGVEDSPSWIRVEVTDTAAVEPIVRSPGPGGESGRGMLIVDSLASSWGIVPTPHGKAVWFRLDLPA
jgi:anti-sigma regulatory factor (Ser/Thr protein kinase)